MHGEWSANVATRFWYGKRAHTRVQLASFHRSVACELHANATVRYHECRTSGCRGVIGLLWMHVRRTAGPGARHAGRHCTGATVCCFLVAARPAPRHLMRADVARCTNTGTRLVSAAAPRPNPRAPTLTPSSDAWVVRQCSQVVRHALKTNDRITSSCAHAPTPCPTPPVHNEHALQGDGPRAATSTAGTQTPRR